MSSPSPSDAGRTIGLVGIGVMGARIAKRLANAGNIVTVYDANTEAQTPDCVARATTLAEVCKGAAALFLSLPRGDSVADALAGAHDHVEPQTTVVDVSTTGPKWARDNAASLPDPDNFVDSPVGGGFMEAEAGTLVSLVGGADDAVANVAPLILAYSSRYYHFGPVGSGQAAKVSLNMSQAVMTVGAAEAVRLLDKLGVDQHVYLEALESLDANAWFQRSVRHFLADDYPQGFRTTLAHKDVSLALDAAAEQRVPVPAAQVAREVLQRAIDSGYGDEHFTAIVKCYPEN